MLNREIYSKDPSQQKLINEGVATVNDGRSPHELNVLRYELETFVCSGKYQDGLERILAAFLDHLGQPQQQGVWVSGFYGSGKSHLVKMLRAFWANTEFPDGKRAREIAELPESVRESLAELSAAGRRYGGLHAASGMLSAGAGSVRLALLSILFKSIGLPAQYPQAQFVMWLRDEGILDAAQEWVAQAGETWESELANLYVAETLHQALVELKPNIFPSADGCSHALQMQFPRVTDVSADEMVGAVRQALTADGEMPLTLIVLDEVQQYIGDSGQRSLDVQEAVEACCKQVGSNLLFIGTGQTAVTGTPNLKKLEGRFTVRVELSDADVDSVIRKVVLAKKATAKPAIEDVMERNVGEISRHLQGSGLAHRQQDALYFAQDYPLLPVRRRFWEQALRVLDQSGTDSQLRNQLSMVHQAIRTNLDQPLGHVIPADYLYFDSATKLLQAHVLPRKVYEKTTEWYEQGTPEQRLMARAAGIIFLVNKVAGHQPDLGLKADLETIADLLVEDLNAGSGSLRVQLTKVLGHCEIVMRVGEEFRIQTEESTAWNDEYQNQRTLISGQMHSLDDERNRRIRLEFAALVPNKNLERVQGKSKTPRKLTLNFDSELPADANERVYVWVRDGWTADEPSVKADARAAGPESPAIFVHIPQRNADDLRGQLISTRAAAATLDKRGVPSTPEGNEARAAVQTIQKQADDLIHQLLAGLLRSARVFKGGGDECIAADLATAIGEAAESALLRLYPQFDMGDHEGWAKAYEIAAKGAPDGMIPVGFNGEPADHPVCREVLKFIGAGKSGADLRGRFMGKPYGWPQDTVDGALQVLLVAGNLRAQNDMGQVVPPQKLMRAQITRTTFKSEAVTISKAELLQIRKLFLAAGITIKPDEERTRVGELLQALEGLAGEAGGGAPRPEPPDTTFLSEIRLSSGNEQLKLLYDRRDTLLASIAAWKDTAQQIDRQWPGWEALMTLLGHAQALPEAADIRAQVQAIVEQRLLLDDPDPVRPLAVQLESLLRAALQAYTSAWNQAVYAGWQELEADPAWQAISDEERQFIAAQAEVGQPIELALARRDDLLIALERNPLADWPAWIDALGPRFARAREEAARLLAPQAQTVTLNRPTLHDEAELEAWLNEAAAHIRAALANGPVILK